MNGRKARALRRYAGPFSNERKQIVRATKIVTLPIEGRVHHWAVTGVMPPPTREMPMHQEFGCPQRNIYRKAKRFYTREMIK